jgi:peroxiredoxin Q/BCP
MEGMRVAIREGDAFISIQGLTYEGTSVDLNAYRGQANVVVYFYPKDLTPGCTREAIDFDRRLDQFEQANTKVVGISVDPKEAHQAFATACGLHFPLLSDSDQAWSNQLGILNDAGTYAQRTTFVVDKSGTVRKIYAVKQVDGHADEVLAFVQTLA